MPPISRYAPFPNRGMAAKLFHPRWWNFTWRSGALHLDQQAAQKGQDPPAA